MSKLKIKDLKISLPDGKHMPFSNDDLADWIAFELGVKASISTENPLWQIDLRSCEISYSDIEIIED